MLIKLFFFLKIPFHVPVSFQETCGQRHSQAARYMGLPVRVQSAGFLPTVKTGPFLGKKQPQVYKNLSEQDHLSSGVLHSATKNCPDHWLSSLSCLHFKKKLIFSNLYKCNEPSIFIIGKIKNINRKKVLHRSLQLILFRQINHGTTQDEPNEQSQQLLKSANCEKDFSKGRDQHQRKFPPVTEDQRALQYLCTFWHLQSSRWAAGASKSLSTKFACWPSPSPTDTAFHLYLSLHTVAADSDKIISSWTTPASGWQGTGPTPSSVTYWSPVRLIIIWYAGGRWKGWPPGAISTVQRWRWHWQLDSLLWAEPNP